MSLLVTPPKRWTVDEVERLASLDAGFGKVELVGGELYNKTPQSDPHWYAHEATLAALLDMFGLARLTSQKPAKFGLHDAPEPDVAVFRRKTSRPGPGDVDLVVEISDTSLAFDLGEKAATYARHGVREYWVVDLNRREVVVHRDPDGETWTSVERFPESAALTPLAAPEATFLAASLMRTEPV